MDPLTMALIAGAGSAVTKGVAGAIDARKLYTDEDERRRKALEARRAAGTLGLSGRERAALEARSTAAQGAALRDIQNLAPMGPNMGQRELFLSGLTQQGALAEARQTAAAEINKLDAAEAAAQRAEISTLAGKEAQRKAATRSALLGGLATGAAGTADVLMQDVAQQRKLEMDAEAARAGLSAQLRAAQAKATEAPVAPMPGYTGKYGFQGYMAGAPSFWTE